MYKQDDPVIGGNLREVQDLGAGDAIGHESFGEAAGHSGRKQSQ